MSSALFACVKYLHTKQLFWPIIEM